MRTDLEAATERVREAERATKALADELRVAEQQRGSTGSELEQSLRAANAALRDSELRLAGETERCARETERARAAERDCDDYVVRVNEQAETIGALEERAEGVKGAEGAEGRAEETAALRERLEAAEAATGEMERALDEANLQHRATLEEQHARHRAAAADADRRVAGLQVRARHATLAME